MDCTVHQAPLSMGFPGQEYWSGLLLPSPLPSSCYSLKLEKEVTTDFFPVGITQDGGQALPIRSGEEREDGQRRGGEVGGEGTGEKRQKRNSGKPQNCCWDIFPSWHQSNLLTWRELLRRLVRTADLFPFRRHWSFMPFILHCPSHTRWLISWDSAEAEISYHSTIPLRPACLVTSLDLSPPPILYSFLGWGSMSMSITPGSLPAHLPPHPGSPLLWE